MTEQDVDGIIQQLHVPEANVVALLEAYWTEEYTSTWQQDIRLYHTFGRALISTGHPNHAFELARAGLEHYPDDPFLQYLCALALGRGGNTSAAMGRVYALLHVPGLGAHLTIESLSLAGRLAKDRYAQTRAPALKSSCAADSAAYYEQAHQHSTSSFPSINAATMRLLAGEPQHARALATEAMQRASLERQQPGQERDYWLLATLGEASLLLGRQGEAVQWYSQAVEYAAGRLGDIASMRRQVQLLAEHLTLSEAILALFNVGHVVVFSGHMIDHPTRQTHAHLPPRFPPDTALEASVTQALHVAIEALNATVGYSSAACGADILFAEVMLQRHKELHIVLPFKREDFCITSVDFGLDVMAGWRARFEAVLGQAEVHYATTQPFLGDDILFTFVNTFTQGLAITRAAHLGVEPYALVVRDPTTVERPGGTMYFLRSWQAGERRVAPEIDLAALRSHLPRVLTTWSETTSPDSPGPAGRLKREVKAMLFGDIRHFSHLGDEQIPDFLCNVFDHVADMIAQTQPPPAFCNTWGDGLFLVFHTVRECADFALRLLEWLGTVRWVDMGLPEETSVRLGLHAGPVYPYHDRILDRQNFFGNHVNRAARIEPVTTPGCAYASEQFAAMIAVECDHAFVCDYVGVENLAKGFDRCPLYRVRRRG